MYGCVFKYCHLSNKKLPFWLDYSFATLHIEGAEDSPYPRQCKELK